MKRFTIARSVTEVALTYVDAETEDEALEKIQDNANDFDWKFSSYEDDDRFEVVDVDEFEPFE